LEINILFNPKLQFFTSSLIKNKRNGAIIKFVNETRENYIEELKQNIIDIHLSELSSNQMPMSVVLTFSGIILTGGSFFGLRPLAGDSIVLWLVTIGVMFLGALLLIGGSTILFEIHKILKNGLTDDDKERLYQECLDISNYTNWINTYTLLRTQENILKYGISEIDNVGKAKITVYYETNESIVETETFYATIKQHTKIDDSALHLTENGFVLYVPYNDLGE